MALDILEWGIILLMGAGLLFWGPEKIPEMAKTIARARKEFEGATKQLQGITKELQTGMNSGNLNLDAISDAIIGAGATAPTSTVAAPQATAQASPAALPAAITPAGAALPAPETSPFSPKPKKSADQMLIEMARSLKIETQGKTKDEISQAIMDAVSNKSAEPAAATATQAAPAEAGSGSETNPVQAPPEKQEAPAESPATAAQ